MALQTLALILAASLQNACAGILWPPSAQGDPDTMGNFDSSWQILSGEFAAHAAAGGRTVAKRGNTGVLSVFLPGTFTVPQQFSVFLKASADMGFDTIGLDYAWGPSPDSARSAQCVVSADCQACQENFHEIIGFGSGEDLITGPYPVYGDNQTDTLKFTHFYTSGVQFLPSFELGDSADVAGPVPSGTREYVNSIKDSYSIEVLLVSVLQKLGWNEYLLPSGLPDWSKVVISGHSQGASHAGYVAYKRNVLGAKLFSGPQDVCGDDGARWVAAAVEQEKKHIFGCYALDEPGRPAIQKNVEYMTDVVRLRMEGRTMNHGSGEWCAPPEHCATAVDDQLAQAAEELCFSKLKLFLPMQEEKKETTCGQVKSAYRQAKCCGSPNKKFQMDLLHR